MSARAEQQEVERPIANQNEAAIGARAEELFLQRFDSHVRRTDRLLSYLMVGQWIFGILIAVALSPYSWEGKERAIHVHLLLAVVLGGAITSLPLLLAWKRPGAPITRYTMAAAQMLWSALLIHLTGGRIETHFHVFGSLAFLAFYRDWKVMVPATLVVALDHLLRQLFYPESVFGILTPEGWRFLEHAFWVLFEDVFLVIACVGGIREMRAIAEQQARIEFTEHLEKEMEIAARIQTGILPQHPVIESIEFAARMLPASEVGGDYYDVLPVAGDGCWIGIGDVAGHGLIAGLVMLQTQSAIKALICRDPDQSPREVLGHVNRVLYENVRDRLQHQEHMTMSLIRYHADGRLVIAGAHQAIVICRAASGKCEKHQTRGTWLGLVPDILPHTEESHYELREGDLLILFTDGVTEAMDGAEQQFGIERLCREIESRHGRDVGAIRDGVLDAVSRWTRVQDDDVTLVVLRHHEIARAKAA